MIRHRALRVHSNATVFLAVIITASLRVFSQAPADKDRVWAFPVSSAVIKKSPVPEIEGPQHIAGSTQSYTQQELDLMSTAVDWFPDRHQPMPQVVRDGSTSGGFACGSCHLANGLGHPESADLVGLTPEYFIQTMGDFKNGTRKDPIRMSGIAKATSDTDIREAAAWFATLKPGVEHWTRVVETNSVPKTYLGQGRMRFVDPDGGTEPIGNRIITVPEDASRARARDPASGFIAYVPTGSIRRGRALASGGGKTLECAICHGPGLQGAGNIPPLAGNHPIYIVRQLHNFKDGANDSPNAQLMKRVVANLTDQDIVALAAYVGSLALSR